MLHLSKLSGPSTVRSDDAVVEEVALEALTDARRRVIVVARNPVVHSVDILLLALKQTLGVVNRLVHPVPDTSAGDA
jgi:hypothetical protein